MTLQSDGSMCSSSSRGSPQPWWLEHAEKNQVDQEIAFAHKQPQASTRAATRPVIFMSIFVAAIAASLMANSLATAAVAIAVVVGSGLFLFNPAAKEKEAVVSPPRGSDPRQRNRRFLDSPCSSNGSSPSSLIDRIASPLLTPTSACIHHYYMSSPWRQNQRHQKKNSPQTPDSALSGQRTPHGMLWQDFGFDLDGHTVCNVSEAHKAAGTFELGDELVTVGTLSASEIDLHLVLASDFDRVRVGFRSLSNKVRKLVLVRQTTFDWDTMENVRVCSVENDTTPPDEFSEESLRPKKSRCGFCSLGSGRLERKDLFRMEKWFKPCNFCVACEEFE